MAETPRLVCRAQAPKLVTDSDLFSSAEHSRCSRQTTRTRTREGESPLRRVSDTCTQNRLLASASERPIFSSSGYSIALARAVPTLLMLGKILRWFGSFTVGSHFSCTCISVFRGVNTFTNLYAKRHDESLFVNRDMDMDHSRRSDKGHRQRFPWHR